MPSLIQVPIAAVITLPTVEDPLIDAEELMAGGPTILDDPSDQMVREPASFVACEETNKYFPR